MNVQEVTVVRPHGRLDAAGSPQLESELGRALGQGHTNLVVDLSDTSYISSNGLRVLLGALKVARHRGGGLRHCCLSPRLTEIFEMVGFNEVFEIYSNRAEAERASGGSA